MRIVVIGCEYAGKTTLGAEIAKWWMKQTGVPAAGFHDHFLVPQLVHKNPPLTDREEEQIAGLMPSLLEKFQRYNIEYHLGQGFLCEDDHWLIDWFYADAVYAPLYYGYGGAGEYSDRRMIARWWEEDLKNVMPDVILVLMKALPEVIRQRMKENPHPKGVLREPDVERVLATFQEMYDQSHILRKFELDTSASTLQESLEKFTATLEPLLTEKDRIRIMSHHMMHARP